MTNKYFSMVKNSNNEAHINIYGVITSMCWFENDVSADGFVKALEALGDVSKIKVYINSYGGEVAEGLAIYNALKRHKAHVVTYCDGMACSIASVIFMAGDERIMNESSLLMMHNAWIYVQGNADELRKQADDLEKITQASITAYKAHSNLSEEKIKALLDAETWLSPDEALEYGFATAIEKTEKEKASQNARARLFEIIMKSQPKSTEAEDEEDEKEPEDGEEEKEPEAGEKDPETDDGEGEDTEDTEDEEGKEEPEDDSEKTNEMVNKFFNAILNYKN